MTFCCIVGSRSLNRSPIHKLKKFWTWIQNFGSRVQSESENVTPANSDIKTTWTPAIAENEKWFLISVRFFTNFWSQIRVRRKNAESCLSRLRHSGSVTTSAAHRSTPMQWKRCNHATWWFATSRTTFRQVWPADGQHVWRTLVLWQNHHSWDNVVSWE